MMARAGSWETTPARTNSWETVRDARGGGSPGVGGWVGGTPLSSPRFDGMNGAPEAFTDGSSYFVGDDFHRVRGWIGSTPHTSPQSGSVDLLEPLREKGHLSHVQRFPQTLSTRVAPPASALIPRMEDAGPGNGDKKHVLPRDEQDETGVESHARAMPTHPPLIDLSVLSDNVSDLGGGNEVSPVVLELGSGGEWQEKSREEDPYLSRGGAQDVDIQSPALEIKRLLYNIFHDAMQYARNKGDIDLHRMISGSLSASSKCNIPKHPSSQSPIA